MAAGLKLSPDFFPTFAERFDHHCRSELATHLRRKEMMIDAEVPLGSLTTKVVDAIDELEPYGISNPRPLLLAENVIAVGEPRIVGAKKNHAQLKFSQGGTMLKAIAFNMASRVSDLPPGTPCAVVFEPSINEWNGRREVQMSLKDYRVHAGED